MDQDQGSEQGQSLVVVGASAGGIDALSVFVASLPSDFPVPIVIAQHLDPSRASHLHDILGRRTTLPVKSVAEAEPLKPGTIFVVPADRQVSIDDHEVRVRPGEGERPAPSIDRLFRTASDVYGERLIALILSGTGSDGASGARTVKQAGGTVVIQDPETATYPSMPLSLSPTTVDVVADLEAMGPLLVDLLNERVLPAQPEDERTFDRFIGQLREQTGIDFSTYKRPTIARRLQRRMTAVNVPHLRDYIRYVGRHPEEYGRLASSFLIKVTEFFRDPEMFRYLQERIIPQLISQAREHDRELRIWSAGCATGEEAYSLAIAAAEAAGGDVGELAIRIFATDLDAQAIEFARRGIYPLSAVRSISPQVLDRYFIRHGDEVEIAKSLRAITVFGQHDLAVRAPFPRIDLAVSRNVLIYFTPELQRRALQLFAFSLREGGFLVLGKAESTRPLAEFFSLEEPKLKVYLRLGERLLIPPARIPRVAREELHRSPVHLRSAPEANERHGAPTTAPRAANAERADSVLLHLPVGVVVVDASYDIQLINVAARRMLGIHGTAVGRDLIHEARSVNTPLLRESIDASAGGSSRIFLQEASPDGPTDGSAWLRISSQPHAGGGSSPGQILVLVEDLTDAVREKRAADEHNHRLNEDLTHLNERVAVLTRSNEDLLAANQELTISNAELRSSNEELLVGNEEIQAATEEVETLNEELQATNEELETLNEELQATVEELNTTNDDLEARTVELEESTGLAEEQRKAVLADRRRLMGALDALAQGVIVFDGEGSIVFSNAAFRNRRRGANDMMPAALKPLAARVLAGETVDDTVELETSDDGSEPAEVRASGLPFSDGDVRGGFITLVTSRRVAESEA